MVENEKVYIYFHICAINNWVDIVRNIFTKFKEYGVYDKVDEVRVFLLGKKQYTGSAIFSIDKKIKIINVCNYAMVYERFTLESLKKDSMRENFKVFYLHSKGVSLKNQGKEAKESIRNWTNKMLDLSLKKMDNVLNKLDEYDTLGCNFKDTEVFGAHFSGNFWWSKSQYIRKLGSIQSDYYGPEKWILSLKDRKVLSIELSNHTPDDVNFMERTIMHETKEIKRTNKIHYIW
tara:strand:- start:3977 stop:4675 length:699 start_codon:yes stop_codon:yes gene_type:complete